MLKNPLYDAVWQSHHHVTHSTNHSHKSPSDAWQTMARLEKEAETGTKVMRWLQVPLVEVDVKVLHGKIILMTVLCSVLPRVLC